MTTTTKHVIDGTSIWIDADFSQPSSPIYATWEKPTWREPVAGEAGWQYTGLQVADARHDRATAARLAMEWGKNQ